jgi:hypothetical protein
MEAGDKEKGERDDVPYYTDEDETTIVECETTAGPFAMQLRKEWSPNGYERAIELFRRGFYDHSHFFRVVPNFLVQFGIRYVWFHTHSLISTNEYSWHCVKNSMILWDAVGAFNLQHFPCLMV